MQQSLTLLVRMLIVTFVGISVWLVLDSTSNKMATQMFNRANPNDVPANEPAILPPSPPTKISPLPLIGGVLAMLVASIGVEVFYYRRFKMVVQQIESLGGSIRFEPHSDSEYLCFRFGNPTVDLSGKDLDDSNFPLLRWLPRLNSLRASHTKIGTGALQEIVRCSTLRSIDLSNTDFTAEQLEALDRIPALENVLAEANE